MSSKDLLFAGTLARACEQSSIILPESKGEDKKDQAASKKKWTYDMLGERYGLTGCAALEVLNEVHLKRPRKEKSSAR